MLQSIYVAGLWLLLAGAISCAARRDYTADGQGLIDQQQPAGTYESKFPETAQQQGTGRRFRMTLVKRLGS
jgi:predicted outer membrane protein